MRIPRDLSGIDLAKKLRKYGYTITRQTGSHLRLTTTEQGEHHIAFPPAVGRVERILVRRNLFPNASENPTSTSQRGGLCESQQMIS
jgi:predicted RNA binding protein YcfA (HicA-like mRNA interferase family)